MASEPEKEWPVTQRRLNCGSLHLNVAMTQGSGPAVVLLHGVVRCWQDMSPLIAPLAGSYRVFAPDMRGHGQSDRAEGRYLICDYAADVTAFLDEHLKEPAILIGHSLGALIAATVAARSPHLIRAAILEDPPFQTLGLRIGKTPFLALFQGMRHARETSDSSVDRLYQALAEIRLPSMDMNRTVRLGDVRDEASLRFLARCLIEADPAVLDPLIEEQWLGNFDIQATLEQVRCPTLLIQGEYARGGMLPDENAIHAARLIARCRHVKLADVGHHIHAVQPRAMLAAINEFLNSPDF